MGGEGEKKRRGVWRGGSQGAQSSVVQFVSIPDCRDFSWSPTDSKIGCWEGTPSLPKSPSLRYPPGRKSHHVSEVGASRMALTVPPFWGEMGKGLCVVVGVLGGSVGAG